MCTRMSYVALAVTYAREYFTDKSLPLAPAPPTTKMHSDGLSRQDTLPAAVPLRNEPLLYVPSLSRQDTLPAEDPVWSYPLVAPELPAPIPPRNEPLLYIPKNTRDDSGVPALQVSTIICRLIHHVLILACSSLRTHLSRSPCLV